MNVNFFVTRNYEEKSRFWLGKNKPNSKPNKPNFQKAQMNVNFFVTNDYEDEPRFQTPAALRGWSRLLPRPLRPRRPLAQRPLSNHPLKT